MNLRHLLAILPFALIGCGRADLNIVEPSVSPASVLPLLQYKVVGNCDDPTLRFQAVQMSGIVLWTDANGPLTMGQAELFLFKDLTYRLDYSERDGASRTFMKTETGSYRFQDNQIDLGELGRATLLIGAGGRVGVEMVFGKNLNSVQLRGRKILGRVTLLDEGPQTHAEICGS